MIIKRIILAAVFALLVAEVQAQQAITYTQYGAVSAPLNTAASFLRTDGEINIIGRQQWIGIEGAPQTYRATASLPTFKSGISAGLNINHSVVAVERSTDAVAFVGKSINLTAKNHLALSIGVGASFYKGNFSGLDSQDPAFRDDITETNGLFSLGLLFYQPEKYYVGVSLPKLTFSKLGLTNFTNQAEKKDLYHVSAGAIIPLGKMFDLKPAGLVTWAENLKPQVNVSAMFFLQKTVGLGVDLRTYGDIAGMAQLNVKRLIFGYSYQFNAGSQPLTKGILNNTHEMGISYRFGNGPINIL